ncbi:putative activation/secretion signal peptide protein [Collimonas arenae]|uniref:Putative activation/secretion signal peptide protein n=1 Tax=Collimonas arenae TaxID=279058 RepID=A0A0A1FB72_9BURK|nr:POTRA domain-containing protein [Collimonas arenae]AIY40102.1 putative activation/secretion signal peptide protein [Collimonas arenae]
MQLFKSKCSRRAGLILAHSAYWLMTTVAMPAHADSRSPLQGNPTDSLPKVEAPSNPTVTINVQTQPVDPAMQKLLASHLTPASFKISGVNALPFAEVAALFAPMANRDTTVAELLTAANKVTQMYQDRGYPLSFAFVPAQSFENNVVVITVVEGYVKNVKVEGNPGGSEERLKRIGEQLQQDRPLRRATFERVAGILSLQPGVKIVANVAPPTTTDGAADMVLTVTRKPITVGVGADYRQPGIRGLLNATSNGLTPLGEQVSVSTLQPSGDQKEKYYAINYVQPIGTDGLTARINASDYRAQPQNAALAPLNYLTQYQTKTTHVGGSLSYPVILDNTHSLTVTGGAYSAENSQTYTPAPLYAPITVTLSSQVRVLSAEAAWVDVKTSPEKLQQTRQLSVGVYKAIDGLGNKSKGNNVDVGFTRVTLQASQSNQLPGGFGVAIAASTQYSSNILPTSEQIGFGGKLFGLAYPAGEVAGDKGWGISAEVNRLFPMSYTYLKSVQPYFLVDHSRVYSNAGPLTHDTLGSVALGVRFSDAHYYTLDLSVAKPVANIPVNSNSRSLRFNAMYSYQLD